MRLRYGLDLAKNLSNDAALLTRGYALRHKYRDFTMIGPSVYAGNISLLQFIRDVPGCIVECGVWRGGMSAGMADVLGESRKYFLFDSFEGLPPAQDIDGIEAKAWQEDKGSPIYYDNCKAEVDFAKRAMAMSLARDVTYVQGWFSETVEEFQAPGGIAVLRLDGDWYESTMQCLKALYPQVVEGGLIIIDDYYAWDGCCRAVHEYLAENQSLDRLRSAHQVAYIIKDQKNRASSESS